MATREDSQNWHKAPDPAAVQSVMRAAAGAAPTQGGGAG
jgi:hypothetical protein